MTDFLGTKGDDVHVGGIGDDALFDRRGQDSLYGDTGSDIIFGGSGRQQIAGFDGDDLILGGRGADAIYGGRGDDILVGGKGADTFFFDFNHHADSIDRVLDFKPGVDTISVYYAPRDATMAYDADTGFVTVDPGGINVHIAKLSKGLTLHEGDLVI